MYIHVVGNKMKQSTFLCTTQYISKYEFFKVHITPHTNVFSSRLICLWWPMVKCGFVDVRMCKMQINIADIICRHDG